jgi:hypothetical protein
MWVEREPWLVHLDKATWRARAGHKGAKHGGRGKRDLLQKQLRGTAAQKAHDKVQTFRVRTLQKHTHKQAKQQPRQTKSATSAGTGKETAALLVVVAAAAAAQRGGVPVPAAQEGAPGAL